MADYREWDRLVNLFRAKSPNIAKAFDQAKKHSIRQDAELTALSALVAQLSSPAPGGGGGDQGSLFISDAELTSKPTSGAGYTFLLGRADLASYGTVNLATQNSFTQTNALGGALVYARTGTSSYKTKVESYLVQVPGTQDAASQGLNVYRQVFGWVCAADLVGFDYSTVCNNGDTWTQFLQEIRTQVFAGNTRWNTMLKTIRDTSSNWGAVAMSSYLAVSYALNDTAAIAEVTDIYKRYLGDTTAAAAAFVPTASYNLSSNGATWDMTPTLERGINPFHATDGRDGMIIEDGLRLTSGGNDSVACCTPTQTGMDYTGEALDAVYASAQLLRAQGVDLRSFQDEALRRAMDFYMTWGPGAFSLTRYLPEVINYWYGTSYSDAAESTVARQMGYGKWLFAGTP